MARNCIPHAFYSLKDVADAIDDGRIEVENLFRRDKNKATLARLGLTISDAVSHVRNLRVQQFETTSFESGKPPADVYKKTISGVLLYIKFFLEDDLVILSFHTDEARKR